MKLGCTFRCCPLKKDGGEAENISNFDPFQNTMCKIVFLIIF